jgi:hypothetical protein
MRFARTQIKTSGGRHAALYSEFPGNPSSQLMLISAKSRPGPPMADERPGHPPVHLKSEPHVAMATPTKNGAIRTPTADTRLGP